MMLMFKEGKLVGCLERLQAQVQCYALKEDEEYPAIKIKWGYLFALAAE